MEEQYARNYFEAEQSHWWWIARRALIKRIITRSLQRRDTTAFSRALEIGCFSGKNMEELHSYAGKWVGIEPSEEAAAQARQAVPDATIITGTFPETSPAGPFDLVIMFDVLEHIQDDEGTLTKIFSLMQPDGMLLVTVPAYQWLWTTFDEKNRHYRRYTRRLLLKQLHQAGFYVAHIGYFNTLLFLPAVLRRLLMKLQKPGEEELIRVPRQMINKILQYIFALERFFVPPGFPFGLSVMAAAQPRQKRIT